MGNASSTAGQASRTSRSSPSGGLSGRTEHNATLDDVSRRRKRADFSPAGERSRSFQGGQQLVIAIAFDFGDLLIGELVVFLRPLQVRGGGSHVL